jgi:hypothetical protein
LVRDQQIVERSVVWRFAGGQTSLAEINQVTAFNNRCFGAARIYDYEASFDFISMIPKINPRGSGPS